jgi:hypothetical protein
MTVNPAALSPKQGALLAGANLAAAALLPTVSISGADSATEGTPPAGGGTLVFHLSRTGGLSAATTVTYSIGGSSYGFSATSDDLASGFGNGSVTFAAGASTAVINVPIAPDATPEQDELVQLNLLGITGGNFGSNIVATAAILNDDGPVPTPTIVSITGADDALEGTPPGPGGVLVFHLGRTGDLSAATTVTYSVGGSPYGSTSATADDLTNGFGTGSVTFAAGVSAVLVDVQIAPDVTVEPDEQVQLSLQTITGGAFGSTIQATANILDDDEPTVSITHTVDSFEGTTNLIPNSLEFDLTRTGNLSTATTVTFTSSGGTAQANDVYYWQAVGQVLVQTPGFGSTPITFAAGEATKSVFVPIQPDSVIEPDETVVGTLSDAVGGRLGATTTATATILDDDHRSVVSIVSVDNAAEGTPPGPGGIAIFHLTRTGDLTDAPIVSYSVGGGTATPDDVQGGFYNGTATFALGQRDITVSVQWVPDSIREPNETVNLTLTGVAGGMVGTANQLAATILDDDTPPPSTIIMSEINQEVLEGTAPAPGGMFTFTIHRIGDLPDQQIVSYVIEGTAVQQYNPIGPSTFTTPATADDFQGGFGAGSVTFAPGQQDATVTIQANPDAVPESDETFQLRLTGVTGGTPGATLGQIVYDPFGRPVDDQIQDGATILNDDSAIACFCTGTLILTPDGERAVESLRIGDRVRTAMNHEAQAGNPAKAPPGNVVWIGHRHTDCAGHPRPRDVWPIRIRAHAFGCGTPQRDLLLSPDHAVFVEGVLIPVRHLINNATIVQEEVREVTYWHVEMDSHDVILADGLPCESYLDTGNRGHFENGGSKLMLHPDFARAARESGACAPLVVDGPERAAVHRMLHEQARRLGYRFTAECGLRVRSPAPLPPRRGAPASLPSTRSARSGCR